MTNRPDKLPILRALDEEASHLEFSPTDKFSTILKASALTSFGEAMEEEFNAEQGNTSQYVHSEATDILQCALLTMTPEEKAHLLQQGTTLPKMPTISGIPPAFFSASVTSITTTLFPRTISASDMVFLLHAGLHPENNIGQLPTLFFSSYIRDQDFIAFLRDFNTMGK
uniref:Uncharacterized protein n=1 Tax=Physcomitrium patens TaxID=3218 RepID=A0A2K1K1E3_PHYPA|nr:hypothetical protein PHYPA_012076 [Physcomitrium patens]